MNVAFDSSLSQEIAAQRARLLPMLKNRQARVAEEKVRLAMAAEGARKYVRKMTK